MREKIVVNNEIIIFMSEIAFFTNETNLAIYTLINYKNIIPTYVPCICICCVIAIVTVAVYSTVTIDSSNYSYLMNKILMKKIGINLIKHKI